MYATINKLEKTEGPIKSGISRYTVITDYNTQNKIIKMYDYYILLLVYHLSSQLL